MKKQKLPRAVKSAASSFNKVRADYYKYLASMIEASKGNTKLVSHFERDAKRYIGKPRGVLSAYWGELFLINGCNLADTWQGTLPDDEVSVIRVAQDAGDGALMVALFDVARIAMLSDKVKKEVIGTLMAAVFGATLALFMLTVFPIFASAKLQEVYSFIPLDQWGPKGTSLNNHAERVKSYGVYFVMAVVFILAYFNWTIANLTGPLRNWLDEHTAIYQTIRDLKGAMFLSIMATLTRKRGNVMYTLAASLSTLASSARSPWMKWRLEEIVGRIETSGATNSDSFKTNMISPEMYYYLCDTQEARGFSEGFSETGKYVETNIVDKIIKRMGIFRWVLLLFGVACVVFVMGWQFSVIYEMKSVMSTYYSSR